MEGASDLRDFVTDDHHFTCFGEFGHLLEEQRYELINLWFPVLLKGPDGPLYRTFSVNRSLFPLHNHLQLCHWITKAHLGSPESFPQLLMLRSISRREQVRWPQSAGAVHLGLEIAIWIPVDLLQVCGPREQ